MTRQQGGIGRFLTLGLSLGGVLWASTALADPAWVQIEAKPALPAAEERAQAWAQTFPNVEGFAMASGWYAIALGPYDSPQIAQDRLSELRADGAIPRDSYVARANHYRSQFWPLSGDAAATAADAQTAPPAEPDAAQPFAATIPAPAPDAADTEATETDTADNGPADETQAESRAHEATLDRATRAAIQAALDWTGFYDGAPDGAFGRGTRIAIAAWQQAQGFEATGVLSTRQQAQLLDSVQADRGALGIQTVTEDEAGISIDLPLGLVEFDRYDPPFVRYKAKDGSGVTVLLISRKGDADALAGLYDTLQTLPVMPPDGARSRKRGSFVMTGQNAQIHSYAQAALAGAAIKGFVLVWPATDEARMQKLLDEMKASFAASGTGALDPGLGEPLAVPRADLTSGLGGSRPVFARSGVFIGPQGAVLTAAAGLTGCARVTVEGATAHVTYADSAQGIAVLTPLAPLAPRAVATFAPGAPVQGAKVAVAGFSYPEAMNAPVVSFGTLSALEGLEGETGRARLAVPTRAGDAGGPVLDAAGAVVGMVLPRDGSADKGLPPDLTEAVRTAGLTPVLAGHGLAPAAPVATAPLSDAEMLRKAAQMTAQVACWN